MNTAERKTEIRKMMAERRRTLSDADRVEAGRLLRERLTSHPLWPAARALAAFWPLGKEPDIAPLLTLWVKEGRSLALPRVEGSEPKAIQLYRIVDPSADLAPGTLGILEPDPARCAVFPPEALDWIWVPGTAFDTGYCRLGRGKAYYDSLLSRVPRTVHRTGVAYDWQIVDSPLPLDPWDQPLDSVVTDRRTLLRGDTGR